MKFLRWLALVVLTLSAVADAQVYPFFPPPGTTYKPTPTASFGVAENSTTSTAPTLVANQGTAANQRLTFATGTGGDSGLPGEPAVCNTFKICLQLTNVAAGDAFLYGQVTPEFTVVNLAGTGSAPNNPTGFQVLNDSGQGWLLVTSGGGAATQCGPTPYQIVPAGACSWLDPQAGVGVIGWQGSTVMGWNGTDVWLAGGAVFTPIVGLHLNDAGGTNLLTTLGDNVNATSVTNIVGGSAANTQANGTPILTGFNATSASLGGGALAAGACASNTTTVTGATTGMAVDASPSADPGVGFSWNGFVSAANTVTTRVCAIVAGTPTASAYNIRVIK